MPSLPSPSRRTALGAVVLLLAVVAGLAPAPASAAGTGTVSGRVTGPDGQPVGGACVRTSFGTINTTGSTTTDTDGAYRVTGVPTGNTFVLVLPCTTSSDAAPSWFRSTVHRGQALAVVVPEGGDAAGTDVALLRGGSVSGRVTDRSGSPVSDGCVALEAIDQDGSELGYPATMTGTDGRYRFEHLPAVPYRVRVDCHRDAATAYAPGTGDRSSARSVTPPTGGSVADVDVVLPSVSSLTGRVLAADGGGLAGQCVQLLAAGPADYYVDRITTDGDGRWRLDRLSPGGYAVQVTDCTTGLHLTSWYDGAAWTTTRASFTVPEGRELALAALTAPTAGAVSGHVTRRAGSPPGRYCASAYPDGQDLRYTEQPQQGALDGSTDDSYRVGALPAGHYRVEVGPCDGSSPRTWVGGDDRRGSATLFDVAPGSARTSDLIEPQPATAAGTLHDDLGRPVRGCVLLDGRLSLESGSDGTYTTPPLYPRSHVLGFFADCSTALRGTPPDSSTTVDLQPGEKRTGVDGAVSLGLSLSGHVRNSSGDGVRTCVTATAPGQEQHVTQSDAAGAWRLDGLPTAAWTLLFRVCNDADPNLAPTYYPGVPFLIDAVPVPLGLTAVTGLDVVMPEGARVTGTLTRADGKPVPRSCVVPMAVGGGYVPSVGGVTDDAGHYDLRALPPGAVVLLASHCSDRLDASTPARTYYPGDTTRLRDARPTLLQRGDQTRNWQLRPGGTLTGRVTDSAGTGLPACLSLRTYEPYDEGTTALPDGTFLLAGLGDTTSARLRVTDCGRRTYASAVRTLKDTASGRRDVLDDVALSVAAHLRGTVRRDVSGEPVARVCVSTSDASFEPHDTTTAADGTWSIDDLPAGDYVLRFSDCSPDAFVVDEYYDDSLTRAGARTLHLDEGQVRTGIDASLLTVTVPGVPRTPTTVVSGGTSTVRWVEPASDGGSPITSYTLRDAATGSVLLTVPGGVLTATLPGTALVTIEAVNRRGAGPRTSLVPAAPDSASQPPTPAPYPAPASPPSQPVRVSLSPSAVAAGQRVTVVYRGRPGEIVTVLAKTQPAAAFTRLLTLTLDATGTATSTHLPQRNTRLTATTAAGLASPDQPLAQVRSVTSLTVTRTAGRTYRATGRVYPARTGRIVSLYRGTTLLGQARTDESGVYVLNCALARGAAVLTLRAGDDVYNLGSSSKSVRVSVA